MKIRKIYLLFSLVASSLYFTSCKDELNVAPDGRITLDEVFSDNDKVGAFLNTCYNNLPEKGVHYFFWTRGPVEWSDEAWDADELDVNWVGSARLYDGSASAADHPINWVSGSSWDSYYWAKYFTNIRNCTIFLKNIGTATVREPADRKRWTAEAHLLRAFYYAELLKWYGCDLPLESTPYDLKQDFSKIKRASYHDVVKFIIADCDTALGESELPWRIRTDGENGRIPKGVAEALKSRMSLYAASPLYNGGNNYWEEAYTINKTVLANLKAQGFELYKTINFPQVYKAADAYFPNEYAALYNEYFTNAQQNGTNPIDKETIWQYRDGQGGVWGVDGVGAQNGYKTGTCPSQELVDSYETSDGQPVLKLDEPYADEKHTQPNYNPANTLYKPEDPYANRDPRFYASIYYNGSKRKAYWTFDELPECKENYDPSNPAKQGNRTRIIATWKGEPKTGIDPLKRYGTRTGYYERKFLHPFAGDDYQVGAANFKYFRLGEIILNFAEAAAEYNKLDEARDAVNEIRRRVGMPDLPTGLGKDELIRRIKNERRVELALEEQRYFDVRRWSSPTGDLSKTDKWVTAMEIHRNDDGTYTYTRRPVRFVERKCYTNKFLKVAIPIDEANLMKSLTGEEWQNPGW